MGYTQELGYLEEKTKLSEDKVRNVIKFKRKSSEEKGFEEVQAAAQISIPQLGYLSKTPRTKVRSVFLSMLGNRWLTLHRSHKVCTIAISDMSKINGSIVVRLG